MKIATKTLTVYLAGYNVTYPHRRATIRAAMSGESNTYMSMTYRAYKYAMRKLGAHGEQRLVIEDGDHNDSVIVYKSREPYTTIS